MALKDWIIESKKYGGVHYIKKVWLKEGRPRNKNAVRISISPFDYSATNKYQVLISHYYTNKITHKFFKTKAQTMNFVKSYMRSH